MTALVQHGLEHPAGGLVVELFQDGIGGGELCHIQHGIRVTGKHAGAAGAVHAALAALGTLGVVVAVDHGTVQRTTDKVELVAELCHLVGTVLVAGQNFINRVNNNR